MTAPNIRFVQVLEVTLDVTHKPDGMDWINGGQVRVVSAPVRGLLGLDVKGALWQYDYGTKTWSPFSTTRAEV